MEKNAVEVLPISAVMRELETLRRASREAVDKYFERLEAGISEVQASIEGEKTKKNVSNARYRDFRDILTLLRTSEIAAGKGRRKDLKKIETVVNDLSMLVGKW